MKKTLLILGFLFVLVQSILSQTEHVFLLGNLKGTDFEQRLNQVSSSIEALTKDEPFSLLLLGDIHQDNKQNQSILFDFIHSLEKKNGTVMAVAGDLDWGNSGEFGLDSVVDLSKRFKKEFDHRVFVPKNGCPGPKVTDLGENIRIIALNSQWWLHPYRKVLDIDSDCKYITSSQIMDELEEAIEEAEGRQVLLVTHHPLISGGIYGGTANLSEHFFPYRHDDPGNSTFIPLFGSFYHNYRRNIGSTQDMSSHEYQTYVKDIESVLINHTNVIICSAHEYDMEIVKTNHNFQLVSGSLFKSAKVKKITGSMYASKNQGFIQLKVNNDSTVAHLLHYDKTNNSFTSEAHFTLNEDVTLEPDKDLVNNNSKNKMGDQYYGGDYQAGFFKRLFFGSLYRDAWTTPLTVPVLNLDTTFGGLTPYKEGGGLQTVSLKFKDEHGRKYAFRSINKTPVKSIPKEFRISLVKDITQDMTATQHPYGTMFVTALMDSTELYRNHAKLYIMPDSPKLGEYREKFGGMFGMLEPKPTELKDLNYSYQNADYVESSLFVFKKLYTSPKYRIDTNLFAKARIFDLFIGDWDRHEDNWKWLGFKHEDGVEFKIYPKDRDHAFSKMDGLFYYLADREWGVAFRENFGHEFSGLVSLTSKGNHMDRMLLSGLSRDDWASISVELMTQVTEGVVDQAQKALPEPIRSNSGQVIAEKLKSRRKHLTKFVDDYYLYLAKEVDVIGTNKKEIIDVERLPNGNTRVQMRRKKDNEILYDRTFKYDETDEVRIYGLGGKDSIYIHGESYRNMLVRIMGGKGKDRVTDVSKVKIGSKRTRIYDYTDGVKVESSEETKVLLSSSTFLNEYDHMAHKSDAYLPIPLFLSNPDDGIGGGFALTTQTFGFGHESYESSTTFKLFSTSNGSNRISLKHKRNFERTDWYFTSSMDFGNSFQYYRFYGVGHNTVLNDSLKDLGFYKTRYDGAILTAGMEYSFLERSAVSLTGVAEMLSDNTQGITYFDAFPSSRYRALNAGGANLSLSLDFRDNPNFTSRGLKLDISNLMLAHNDYIFGKYAAEISYYGSTTLGVPLTLGIKAGTVRNYGDITPFYHLANLGQQNNLRGFLRNRFSGRAANYVNTDLRIHFGKTKSSFLPLYYGVILYHDFGQITSPNKFIGADWHRGYGAGVYITPLNKDFITLQLNVERSVEQDALVRINLGVLL